MLSTAFRIAAALVLAASLPSRAEQAVSLRQTDAELRELTGLSGGEAVDVACAVGSRLCFLPLDDTGGGGMGAVLSLVVEVVKVAIERGCTYVHRTKDIAKISHNVDTERVARFFGIGAGCLVLPEHSKELEDALEHKGSFSLSTAPSEGVPVYGGAAAGGGAGGAGAPAIDLQVAHGSQTRNGIIGQCSEELLQQPSLCVLGRAQSFAHEDSTVHATLLQVLRHWYDAEGSMPEKELRWFLPKAGLGENKAFPFEIVFHVRRGDVTEASTKRFNSDEQIALVLSTLAESLAEAARELSRLAHKGWVFEKARTRGIHWRIHIVSQGTEDDFPVDMWTKSVARAGAELVFQLSPTVAKAANDDLVLPTFAHMAGADMLVHGLSSFPHLAGKYYARGVVVEFRRPRDEPKNFDGYVRERLSTDSLTPVIIEYITSRFGAEA